MASRHLVALFTFILEHCAAAAHHTGQDRFARSSLTMDASAAAMALASHHKPADCDAGLAETIRRIGSELTLEAALAFVDGCSIDSDEEGDVAAPASCPVRQHNEHRVNDLQRAVDVPQPRPLSPRFFALVDTIEDESDSEYVSMEDTLKMLDTREVEDDGDEKKGDSQKQQEISKAVVIVEENQGPKSFTELVQSVGVATTSGSSDNESSSDASARSGGTTTGIAVTSSSSKPAPAARKPRKKAVAAATKEKQLDGASKTANLAKKNPEVQADTSSTSSAAAPKPKKKRVRKQREELLYLREKVVEMQQVLEQLQKGSSTSSDTASSSSTSSASSPTATFDPEQPSSHQQQNSSSVVTNRCGSVAWETLVGKQLQERERAEQENRQLKTQLEGQIKLVRSLERLLIGQNDIEISSSKTSHSKRPKMHFGDSLEDDSAIFQELKRELASAYPRFEREFAASYLKELMGDGGDIQVKKTLEQGMYVEFTASKIVQHSFEVTKKGLWRFISRDGMKSQCYFYHELEESTNDYVARDFGCKIERQYRDVNIHGKQVLKRVTQAHRNIFLWSAVIEPVKFSDAPTMKAVRFRERGWLVMHPVSPENGSEKATIVKTFATFTPDLDESVSATNMAVGAITDLVLDSVEGNIHFCQDIVDRLVLEEEQRASSTSNVSIAV